VHQYRKVSSYFELSVSDMVRRRSIALPVREDEFSGRGVSLKQSGIALLVPDTPWQIG